jgi:hypothetical protein
LRGCPRQREDLCSLVRNGGEIDSKLREKKDDINVENDIHTQQACANKVISDIGVTIPNNRVLARYPPLHG